MRAYHVQAWRCPFFPDKLLDVRRVMMYYLKATEKLRTQDPYSDVCRNLIIQFLLKLYLNGSHQPLDFVTRYQNTQISLQRELTQWGQYLRTGPYSKELRRKPSWRLRAGGARQPSFSITCAIWTSIGDSLVGQCLRLGIWWIQTHPPPNSEYCF